MRGARDRGAPLLGVIENMTGPPHAGDAGATLAAEFAVPLWARIPWHPVPETWQRLAAQL
jgi:Mrp family chromosome partitioning ATPase